MMVEVKICENCKCRNPVTAVECEKCGYDLTFVFPEKIEESEKEQDGNSSHLNAETDDIRKTSVMEADNRDVSWAMAYLEDEDNSVTIKEEVSVGRDCELFNSRMNSSNYTSRIHAKLRIFEGKLQLMDASTNGTFVNDKRISKMEWVDVEEGSIIRFADISFVIRRK